MSSISELDEALDLLFGDDPLCLEDSKGWIKQGFSFCPHIPFGLAQNYGGPCGVLAAVQGFLTLELLQELHPSKDIALEIPFQVEDSVRWNALTRALANMIARSTNANANSFVLVLGKVDSYPVMESVIKCASKEELYRKIQDNLSFFQSDIGVLLFVLSMILTRGVEQVKKDRDDLSLPLVQRFGHSSQDLVNLCLFGKAVSNVHDGDKVLGAEDNSAVGDMDYCLKGITCEVPVGFMTSLEALRYSKVGSYYKNPLNPVWVIGSPSHYSILFGVDPNIIKMDANEKMEMEIREVFNRFDHQEMGFVPIDKLQDLASSLSINYSADLKNQVDPEGMGIILWTNFWNAYQALVNSQSIVPASSSAQRQQPQNWSCPACTFSNMIILDFCEICSTEKPASASLPNTPAAEHKSAANDSKCPVNFNLWHFNGIANSKVDIARCVRVMVSLSDMDEINLHQGQVDDVGLREVIQTKWSNAAVDYADPKLPRIT